MFHLSPHRLKQRVIDWLGLVLVVLVAIKMVVEEIHALFR